MQLKTQEKILLIIEKNWPTFTKEIAHKLGYNKESNTSITKVRYHINKLCEKGKIYKKKIGMASVVWPMDIEKIRTIHELLKD